MSDATRLRAVFDRLDREVVDHVELRRAAGTVLRRHVGFDVAVLAKIDPTTVMWTHCLLDGMPQDEDLEEEVFRNEYGEADGLKLTDLLHVPGHAGTLAATEAAAGPSTRLERIYRPRGVTDELRVPLVDGDTPWGALCLLRSDGVFGDGDLQAVAAIGPSFAVALRRSLLRGGSTSPNRSTSRPACWSAARAVLSRT